MTAGLLPRRLLASATFHVAAHHAAQPNRDKPPRL
jgi:hypothetical protein